MGGSRGLNCAYDFREFDAIKVPTTRRVMGFDENKHKIPNPVLVAIDIRELVFQCGHRLPHKKCSRMDRENSCSTEE
jgi:hypothetical protein